MTCSAISPGSRSTEPLYLTLNAAEERLQLVMGEAQGAVLHAQEWHSPARAMPLLAPGLEHAFVRLGLCREQLPQRLAGIACVRGPGNFTGLRLSMATALGLAKALGVPLAGLDYLPLLAAGPAALMPGLLARALWCLAYARQGEVFVQGFAWPSRPSETPPHLGPTRCLPLEQALRRVQSGPQPCLLLGSGVRRHQAQVAEAALPPGVLLLPQAWDAPRPELLHGAALAATYGPEPVAPLYLRVSDAEENLPQIARKQGKDPAEMRRELERLQQAEV